MTQYAKDYGLLNNVPLINTLRTKRVDYILEEDLTESDLHNKEVELIMKDGDVISGVVREVVNNGIVIVKNGDWKDRELINMNNIQNIEVSEHPYYSFSHKRSLREQKKPRLEFRFNKAELNSLVGKYASINYDGKIIEGKIVDCIFRKGGPNVITLKTMKDETKSIEDYRLRSIKITGSSYREHEGFKRLQKLEEELFMLSESEYTCECSDGPENRIVEPDYLIEKYFEARMKILEGEYVDLNEFKYNWIQETIENRDKCEGKVDNDFYENVKKARDLNNYYELRKSFIDVIFEKVKGINWSEYSKNQTKGEIEALEYIYESGVV